MTVQAFLESSVERLEKAGIGTARLDCLVLLEDATGRDRSWLLAHPNTTLTQLGVKGLTSHNGGKQSNNVKGLTSHTLALNTLEHNIERRTRHEPLAYIRGRTEFYGREFIVNKNVLDPRPESEAMIDLLLDAVKSSRSKVKSIVDVGTGSGALAITAKLELPCSEVIAIDIDPKCLKVAEANAKKHKAKVGLYNGNLFESLSAFSFEFSIVLANLPYVPDDFTLNDAAMQEPRAAIFGGKDGLDVYRKLFAQITKLPQSPKFVITEGLPFQHKKLAKIAASANYRQTTAYDFIQVFQI